MSYEEDIRGKVRAEFMREDCSLVVGFGDAAKVATRADKEIKELREFVKEVRVENSEMLTDKIYSNGKIKTLERVIKDVSESWENSRLDDHHLDGLISQAKKLIGDSDE